MHYVEFMVVSTIILPIVGVASGADECRSSVLTCYDCDSRHDPYCSDPFNKTLPPENKPATRSCQGCCVKFLHKFPDDEWVQRSCTENIIINYFMVDHVCMVEGKGHGKMCFCENDFCNDAHAIWTNTNQSPVFIIVLMICLLVVAVTKFSIVD